MSLSFTHLFYCDNMANKMPDNILNFFGFFKNKQAHKGTEKIKPAKSKGRFCEVPSGIEPL